MTFRALHGLAPGYISILWAPYAPACTRGPWAKAPTLPEEIMSVESATSFKPIFMGRLFYMNFLWDVFLSPTVHNPWHFYYNLLVLEFVLFCLMSKSHWSHRCSVSTEHTGRYAQKMSAMSVQRKISDHVKVNRLQKDAEEFFTFDIANQSIWCSRQNLIAVTEKLYSVVCFYGKCHLGSMEPGSEERTH